MAAIAAANTALSGAAGGITALFTNLFLVERRTGEPSFSILHAMNGSLAGLVAITSGCGVVEAWAAIIIGIVAGWIYLYASWLLVQLRIDDAVDAIPVHMFNGIWGALATGFFASPRLIELAYNRGYAGLFYTTENGRVGKGNLLGCQFILVIFIIGWVFVTMMPFFIWLNYKGWFRADSFEELVGLDISYHGGSTDNEEGDVKEEYIDAFMKRKGDQFVAEVHQSRRVNDHSGNIEPDHEAASREVFEATK